MVIGWLSALAFPVAQARDEDKAKAISNIREAIEGYIAALEEDGLPVPEERFETIVMAV
jgi:predicted RNase H-like HicB family nuclease